MIQIETFTDKTIDPLAQLAVQLWPESTPSEMMDHYREVLQLNSGSCFLLKNENDYIGFIELSVRNDYVEGADSLPVGYIEGIFISPDFRQKGLGQLLLRKAEEWAKARGFKQLCSDAETGNTDSINFHKAIGFEEVSRIVCFVKNLE